MGLTEKKIAKLTAPGRYGDGNRSGLYVQVKGPKIRLYNAKQHPDTRPPWPQSKDEKSIARSFRKAFAKLEETFAELENRFETRPDDGALRELLVLDRAMFGEQAEFREWRALITHWRERLESFAGDAKFVGTAMFPNDELDENGKPLSSWPLGKKRSSKRVSKLDFKHDAAAAAAAILDAHGIKPTATQKSDTQELSIFCHVTAVLAGDDRIYHACRTLVEKREGR